MSVLLLQRDIGEFVIEAILGIVCTYGPGTYIATGGLGCSSNQQSAEFPSRTHVTSRIYHTAGIKHFGNVEYWRRGGQTRFKED